MYIIIPEEMKKLERKYKPYLEGVHLKEDAPKEAQEAYETFFKWFIETLGLDQ